MELTLLNKNTPIANIAFNVRRGYIADISQVHNPEYAPLGLVDEDKNINLDGLADWWEDRSIPDRKNVTNILEYIQMDKQELIVKSLGLSLSDQYWVKPVGSDIQWKDVNFFTNKFSNELGEMFFLQSGIKHSSELNYSSPDLTSNGFLDKRWIISNEGERCLCKNGFDVLRQQPYNEKIASDLLKTIGCNDFVSYELKNEKEPYSICKNFITDSTEYVPATLLRKIAKKENNESEYKYFMRCCKKLKVEKLMKEFLDYTIPFDYLIANEDRNYGNFGLIRNVETLKIEKVAPIFDNGNSLWYRDAFITQNVKSYPFEFLQDKQILLVEDTQKFPIRKVRDISFLCEKTLKLNERIPSERIESIVKGLKERKNTLERKLERERIG